MSSRDHVMSSVTPPRVNHGCEQLMRWMTVLALVSLTDIFSREYTHVSLRAHIACGAPISSACGQVSCPPAFVLTWYVHRAQLCAVEGTDKCRRAQVPNVAQVSGPGLHWSGILVIVTARLHDEAERRPKAIRALLCDGLDVKVL